MVYLEGDAPYELPRLNFDFARPGQNLVWVGCSARSSPTSGTT